MIEAAHITPGEKVLEVAVGPGNTLVTLAGMVGRRTTIYGIDLSPGMLEFTRAKMHAAGFENFVLEQIDCRRLPFESNYFDLLYNADMFDLVPRAEMAAILLEFKRVLKSDGRLVLLNMSKKMIVRICKSFCIGICRPVMMVAEVEAVGFSMVERVYLAARYPSEIVTAIKEVG